MYDEVEKDDDERGKYWEKREKRKKERKREKKFTDVCVCGYK